MDRNDIKLSHIIINVDKTAQKDQILAFCTNNKNNSVGIRFTYLCYDNQIHNNDLDVLVNLLNSVPEREESLFIITDSAHVADHAHAIGIACAVLLGENNNSSLFPNVLYCIENIEYMSADRIVKMWERHHGIPWTIAKTERLIIREQTVDDIDALYEIYSDKEITKYTEGLYEDPREEADYLQKYINNQYRFYEYGIWALTLKESGQLIGRAGISLREGYDIPEIGYVIGKDYRRCGYAKEALTAIMDYASEEFEMRRFMAFTKERNRPSTGLLKSLGFVRSGNALIKGGDHAVYILTKQR